jgi:hypothetical protein
VDVPRHLGRDEDGRQVVEFVPGTLALHSEPLSLAGLSRVGGIVRAIHDASAGFTAPADAGWDTLIPAPSTPPGDELVCHNDLAPWNLLVGDRWVFIDWDGAGPSTRLWDLAYAAQSFTVGDVTADPDGSAQRLAAFVAGYDPDDGLRAELPTAVGERAAAMHELLRTSHAAGREPWSSMYADGHGAYWQAATDYARRHRLVWAQALGVA